jgi:hypothetical protein
LWFTYSTWVLYCILFTRYILFQSFNDSHFPIWRQEKYDSRHITGFYQISWSHNIVGFQNKYGSYNAILGWLIHSVYTIFHWIEILVHNILLGFINWMVHKVVLGFIHRLVHNVSMGLNNELVKQYFIGFHFHKNLLYLIQQTLFVNIL